MKKFNILFFAVLASFIVNSIFFQKNTNAASVPDSVVRRLLNSCDSNGKIKIMEKTYDDEETEFETYDPGIRTVTGNWISADPEGKKVISSIY